jgi:LysR family transcriptional regulator (chromosome initiation inhibitor)
MSLLDPKLQAFMSIIRNHTVHGAAKELGLTQTAVTQRIRALESQLRTTLFTRSRRGMLLTQEGESLNRYCAGAKDLEGQALNQILGAAKTSAIHMTISGPTSLMTSRIVPSCLHLYEKFPQLFLSFKIDDSEIRITKLKQGLVQVIVTVPEQVASEMDSKILRPEKYVLVGSPKWKRRRISDIIKTEKLIDFYSSDETTFNYLKKFNLFNSAKRERIFTNGNDAIIKLFSQGVGYGTLTVEVAAPYVERGDIIMLNEKNTLEYHHALAWYPRPEMPEYFSALIKSIH